MMTIYPTSPLSAHNSNAPIDPPQQQHPSAAVDLTVSDGVRDLSTSVGGIVSPLSMLRQWIYLCALQCEVVCWNPCLVCCLVDVMLACCCYYIRMTMATYAIVGW